MFDTRCSLPTDLSDKAVRNIVEATAQDWFGYSMNEVTNRERERVVRGVKDIVGSNRVKLSEELSKSIVLKVISGMS